MISSPGRRNETEGLFSFKEFTSQGERERMRMHYLVVSNQVVGSCEKEYLILTRGLLGLEETHIVSYC